ncbi:MAG: hypothetical protein JO246_08630 [Frankiaceae bacterium]|nr:hypothetical protein [Frankiaceae bacterium]MBV9869562.1 hypothetical protein [Frankiaceae bacterium]
MDNEQPPPAAQEWQIPADTDAANPDPSTIDTAGTSRRMSISAAVLAGGLIVGGGVGYAVGHDGSSGSSARTAATGLPLSPLGAAGELPGGSAGLPGSGGSGFGGGVAGEQRIQGTLTAKSGSKITVKASDGTTASYSVPGTTEIIRDNSTATLADLKVGDAVLVHLIPAASGSGTVVERVFAGTSATMGGPGGVPGAGQLGVPPGVTPQDGTTSNT